MTAPSTESLPLHTNRLARETSPYLQQHQHNPVDWMPWGPEAFERARREDKPIFLSVGYSTCYWCHVMERQCFEIEAIAGVMNRHFVNIKVDREERPDVDSLYMTAVQVMTRQGGWPMSVWLTPDLKPFYGGTYFPPVDSYGRPGFPSLCEALADAWRDRRDQVHASADELTGIVARLATESSLKDAGTLDRDTVDRLVLRSTDDYEREFGGFGNAPKFPRETLLSLLLTWLDANRAPSPDRDRVARQLRHTLDAMANGGIRDHLGGGFHRYSTDARWLVPHFEIMLYDQAMLAPVYARAARILSEPRYTTVARGICDFVLREMTSPAGTFFTAFDAEVDHREGLNYLWTPGEIENVLGRADAAVFNRVYGVDRGPNFADPHHGNGSPDANILFLPDGPAEESDPTIVAMRERLLAARARRKQPLLDTKIITQWNGLMIAGLAVTARELSDENYRTAAMRAADALLNAHQRADGTLARTSRDGDVRHEATLDDYAAVAVALVELHSTTRDARWRQRANAIVLTAERLFGDAAGGFFFTSSAAQDLIVRQKSASDSPLPSGNAQLADALLGLGRSDAARNVVEAFGGRLASYAESMSSLLEVALRLTTSTPIAVPLPTPAPIDRLISDQIVHLLARRVSDRRIEVSVDIRRGYHINDALVVGTDLHATRLTVGGAAGELVDAIDYPPAGQFQPAFGPSISAYTGSFTIVVRLKTPPPTDGMIAIALSYQACNDTTCLAPAVVRVEV